MLYTIRFLVENEFFMALLSGSQTNMEMEVPYKPCHHTSYHVARLERRGKVVAESRNRIGTRCRGSGWSDFTIHAERAVVKALGDLSQLRGCVLIVVRVTKNNEIACSKPCSDCEKFLKKCMKCYGLQKVMYS
jgi:hypothetical protein